ncbi:helix-turn-helix domain-containing protein [Thermaerobacillus caldiproteolyticus]|uniref:helix-turn-helix domain-containing protein n=1 Tax=Thermaerobacillus caldiproteolyticus TaxID=247480 RepID=UPI00188B5DB3|nr:helix-turn-helix transcriptional regulator [Anoxybacillus caldiproteolyticus]QPA33398.1 helix-turn-helix transcriptional regulator [Anoxybacillus caldiproteolyticus]
MSTEKNKKLIGERLRYLRKKNGLKVWQMLEMLNVPRSTFTSWELGRRVPNDEILGRLAKIYNSNIDFIKGKIDDDSPDIVDLKKILETKKIVWTNKEVSEEHIRLVENLFDQLLNSK